MSHKTTFRLPSGGRIDRDQRIDFTLDGHPMSGYRGDTLASALLANGVSLVGRSFKYHRPRGFLTAGPDEPNGLFTLVKGGRRDPNVPGTTLELAGGLAACRQNGWPSVDLDLMALVSLGKPLLAAGFYYKTFMGPTRRSWMFYERFIRRAAGLGRAVHERDPARYESRNAFADVLVVGAGPSGLAAALTAGLAGARVSLVEQDTLLGGALLLENAIGAAEEWRRQIEVQLESLQNVEIFRRTTALGVYDGNKVALLERRDAACSDSTRDDARHVITTLRARTIIFATGATERPLVFANNDRPGVMLASAARSYLNRFGVVCGGRALVVTNNDTAYDTALDLAGSGVSVAIADCRRTVAPTLAARAAALGIEVRSGAAIVDVLGRRAVKGALLADATGAGPLEHWACDAVYMSGGWSPTVHLTSHGGIKPRYCAAIAAFVPGGYAQGHFGAGALTGAFAFAAALEEGIVAGRNAAAHLGLAAGVADFPVMPPTGGFAIEWSTPSVQHRPAEAFVDFQNDVTARDLIVAHEEGYQSVEHLKRYTTLGMGTDQGRTSNVNALGLMAELRGIAIAEAGTTTFRPPFTPVAIGALAGRNTGLRFRAIRRSPLHHWHVANGGELIEAGPWMRPWYYRWAGKTVQTAYIEEMRQVRSGVGIADVSTLGKLDIHGPDAAEFINRVYVNNFAGLPIGKARYGVMLRDDGAVLDDGTTTRLSETRYFMTTSTAHAEEVISWLEFLLQTAWTDLRVHVTSVTDEWAAMALAGPKARIALELALPGLDFSDAKLPHMACVEVDLNGAPLRVLRLSFSGELAFELYVPAGQGIGLWQHLLARAVPLGLKPYGLEALASLRIEKGYIAGLELDHRNTLDDLGLGKMAARDKAFVGRELRQRRQLQASNRWSLVGIESLEADKTLRGGSILFAVTDRIAGHGRGYITSVTWSTELRKFIALGLYQGGLRHEHETIVCAYPLRGEVVRARIVAPQFVDPEGRRLRV